MKLLSFLLLIVLITPACKQDTKTDEVIIGKRDSLRSNILNEERKVMIYLPTGYADHPKVKYPVVYILDGDSHFQPLTGLIQQLSGNDICPDMIVVAIPNTDRTRDLTPTHAMVGPDGKAGDFKTSGGGEKFISFIEKELMPHVDSAYHTASYRTFIGHSFGGLTVMDALINHTALFSSYIAIDPSMWWDDSKLLNQTREVMQQKKFEGKSLYLAIANTMPSGMDTLQVRYDSTGDTRHIRSILKLADILKGNRANGLNWSYKYYKDDDHGSVPLIAEYDGLHFLFNFYKLPKSAQDKMFDPSPKVDVAAILNDHYNTISKHFGYQVLPPEDMVNNMGYNYMQGLKMPGKAFAMFSLNIKNYPGSANTWDSMGDYYTAQKNKAKAKEYYSKALKLKDNKETKDKLQNWTRQSSIGFNHFKLIFALTKQTACISRCLSQ